MDRDLFDRMCSFTSALQDDICAAIEDLDGSEFVEMPWERAEGGGGCSRILQGGQVIEKGGVNVSTVHGPVPPGLAGELPGEGAEFRATGISLVLHPRNPKAPTVHANFRRIERGKTGWYGGGADLTPHYLYEDDARHFHGVWRAVCARHALADYPAWKSWCDDYFYIEHRGEHRGVGGIFFDRLAGDTLAAADFVEDAAGAFLESYVPILARRRDEPWDEGHREWQLVRRGRYVEFNLVYDRGTVFGLKTRGNIEAILMSLPDPVRWVAGHTPEAGSWEERTLAVLVEPREWV